jgi:hypothetical protein
MKFQQPDAIALIVLGAALGCLFAFALPPDRLTLALPMPSAIIGAGLMKYKEK